MIEVTDKRETRVYQEGREEEAKSLIFLQLNRKLGALSDQLQEQVSQLPLETLENLGEALFDFEAVADLQGWLTQQSVSRDSDGSGAIARDND